MTTFKDEADERRLSAQLEALLEASLAITAELAIDRVLQRIVDLSRTLVGAKYAALGVPNPGGALDKFVTSGMTLDEIRAAGHAPMGKGLLGVLLREPKPIRLRHLEDDPRSAGVGDHHPRMTSFLGVPIIFKGRLLGNLYLTDKIGAEEFSDQDEHLIT
ncbi:MAG TPA: GAF domain-containing protein, partial [Anaerolineae bacterium]|nr:GAF domain-containing protein [Anaerolineae bacterium]